MNISQFIAQPNWARENLHEAIALVLEANRELAAKSYPDVQLIREPFYFSAA